MFKITEGEFAGRVLFDQGSTDPAFEVVSGDVSAISTGAFTVLQVHGVAYPASPSTNTVPVVTGSNVVTYETVPNAALTNSSVTVSGVSGVTGGGTVALGSSITLGMADSTANTLAGYNNSGIFSTVTIGSNLTLSGGTLSATGGGGGTGSGNSIIQAISQSSHGFSVGNVVRLSGSSYLLAKADNVADAEAVGIVSFVSDANDFTLLIDGYVTGLSALSAGAVFFLDPSNAGVLTSTSPTSVGFVNKPLLIADSTTSGYFNNMRGELLIAASSGGGAVSSVFGRTGAVTAQWNDYQFNLIGGTASVSQGGTGQTSLTSHAVLLGEGAVTGVGFATVGTPGRLLIDQGAVDPTFNAMTGDASIASTGVITFSTVNSNVGTYNGLTVNAKGLVTAAQFTSDKACRVATTVNLSAAYSNGTAGVGATLTNNSTQAALVIDGVTLNVNDRVLTWQQSSNAQNGIYAVTNTGSVSTNWVITRATDFDNSTSGSVYEGATVPVTEGTLYTAYFFIETGQGPFTIGTTPIIFTANNAGGAALAAITSTSVLANSSAISAIPTGLQATADGQSLVRKSGTLQWSYSAGTYYVDVRDYGAVPDCRRITDLTCTSGSSTIKSIASAQFTSADVGKTINIFDFTNTNYIARTTIAAVSSISTAIIATAASANLTSANGVTYLGTDNANFFNSALASAGTFTSLQSINANQSLGLGRIAALFPTSTTGSAYLFSSKQLVVPTNVIIDADAFLVAAVGAASTNTSGLANRTFSMIFKPGSCIKRLEMDCCYTMGVQMGNYQMQSHSDIYNLTLWSVGGNNASGNIATSAQLNNAGGSGYAKNDTITLTGGTGTKAVITVDAVASPSNNITDWHISNVGNYSANPSNPVSQGSTSGSGTGATWNLTMTTNSHIGLELCGNDYFIDYYWVKGANLGIHFSQNNDTLVNQLFLIGCSTGAMMTSTEETFILDAQIDTGNFAGFTIDGSHNCQVNGHAFAINSTALVYGIGIGQNDSTNANHNLLINWTSDHHGGDAVRLANTTNSLMNFNTTNATIYAGGGTAIANAIVYGSSVGSVLVTQNRDPGITAFTGTVGGILNDNAGGVYKQYAGYTDGQILVGNSLTGAIAPSTISAGSNITITNSHGVIGITAASSVGGSPTGTAGGGLTGTYPNPALANPSATSLGGVFSISAITHNFLISLSTGGLFSQSQPGFSDLTGSATTAQLPVNQTLREISFSLDGQGSAIAAISGSNTWYLANVPYAGTITSWSLVADKSGSIDIDVWKANAAVPTISNTITASAQCSLASTQSMFAGPITGWSSAVSKGDCIGFNLISASSVTKANLTINITAT